MAFLSYRLLLILRRLPFYTRSLILTEMSFEQLSADPGFESYPLGQPPEGVLPDPKNRQSRGDEVYITAGICLSLILFFAGLRLYAKLKILRARTKDDCKLMWSESLS